MINTGLAGSTTAYRRRYDRSSRSAGPREPKNQSRSNSATAAHAVAGGGACAPGQRAGARGQTTGGSDGRVCCSQFVDAGYC